MIDNQDNPKNNNNSLNKDNLDDPRLNELEHSEELDDEDRWEDIEESEHDELEDSYEVLKENENNAAQADEQPLDLDIPSEEQQEKPNFMATLSKFKPKLPKFGGATNKKTFAIVILLVVIIIGALFLLQHSRVKKQQQQVANQVLLYAAPLQDINEYLGNNLQINGKIKGKLNSTTKSGELVIPTKGNKGTGVLNASFANGSVAQLILLASGKELNVLQDQTKYEAKLAAAAALKKKQEELQMTFNSAMTALQNKNYDAAISGFQSSINNKFELQKSYEYIAFAYSQVNQYEPCVTAYQEYVSLNSQNAESYYQMAYCQLHLMQNNNALDNLTKSCTLGYQPACDAAAQITTELSQQQANTTYDTSGNSGNLGGSAVDNTNLMPNNPDSIINTPNTPNTSNTTTPAPAPANIPNNPAGIPSNNAPNSAATNAVDSAVNNVINNLSNTNNTNNNTNNVGGN